MRLIERIPEQVRGNPEFQSSMVRLAAWICGLCYIGVNIWAGLFTLHYPSFFSLLGAYLVLNLGILVSVLIRAEWEARRYLALFFDILAVSLAILLTGNGSSPLFLFYILIFISAATRYGRRHLAVAATAAVVSYSIVLTVTGSWLTEPMDAAFHLMMLILLPLYQNSLLRKLREARRAAEHANQAKSTFLANMTHELRTPLTGVLGMAELLRTTDLDREQRDYADAITSSASMLQGLIGDILDLSKIDAGKLQLEDRPFDLREAIKQVCGVLHAQAQSKDIEMVCDLSPDMPRLVRGDQLRVRQILFNLIGNAVKFTESGEVIIRAGPAREAAAMTGSPECQGVLLQIEDTGIGIATEQLDAIFDGFSQADDSTTRRYGGTGLGTTISRDLISLMGGHIEVRSELGKGTCFSICLPLPGEEAPAPRAPAMSRVLDEQPAEISPTTGRRTPIGAGGVPRVLVAEDNAIAARVITTLLERQGCEVTLVADGHEALRKARADRFHLAFIDLRMPGLDGIGFTEQLRASEREDEHLNIVTLTANAAEDVKRRCLAAGMDHFLTKPIDPAALRDTLSRYCSANGQGPNAKGQ